MIKREELVANAVLEKLGFVESKMQAKSAPSIGVIVEGVKGLDTNKVVSLLMKTQKQLYACSVGSKKVGPKKGLSCSENIEDAVAWRNDRKCAGKIIVFLNGQVPKRRSLEKFDRITDRDLSAKLIEFAKENFNANEQEAEFWDALHGLKNKFPLRLIEEFVTSVSKARGAKKNQRIPQSLWLMGLVADDEVISRNRKAAERLQRNRNAIEEIARLSEQSRKRMTQVISDLKGRAKKKYETAFQDIMDFFSRSKRESLKNLDLETLETLIKSGRPMPSDPKNKADRGEDVPKPSRPLTGKRLEKEICDVIVSQDTELLDELAEFREQIEEIYENPGEATEEITLNEQAVTTPVKDAQVELGKAVAQCCNKKNWGGWFRSESNTIKEAFRQFDAAEFTGHNPEIENGGGKSLSELLRAFDGRSKNGFVKIFQKFCKTREKLVPFVPLLISHPFVLLATNSVVRKNVKDYLSAYEDLMRHYTQSEAKLNRQSAQANEIAIADLLRLDVIHVHSENEWKAILTPLHPFYLWRYQEVMKAASLSGQQLSGDERAELAKAMQEIPHLLHFLVSSPVEQPGNFKPLPLAGNLQGLPTYENDTNRYLGADGVEFVSESIKLWLGHAPYSRRQVRLAIIDPPSSEEILEQLVGFLTDNNETNLVIDVFTTRKVGEPKDFGVGDLSKQNYLLGDFQASGRLRLRIHSQIAMAELKSKLSQFPVHICFSFDQGSYDCQNASRAKDLIVSPLVVTYDYNYDPITTRGTISPSTDTADGLFSDYHLMVRRISHLGPDTFPRLQTGQPPNVKVLKSVIADELAQWLVCADRDLSAYALDEERKDSIQLLQRRFGQREIGVWSRTSDRTLQAITKFLEKHPLNDPNEERLREIFHQFWHVAATGWPTLLKAGTQLENSAALNALKGALGTIFAAAWYVDRYPGALVATLDSDLAKQWLIGRESSKKRADLVGFRQTASGVVIEPIEVKAHAADTEARIAKDSSGKPKLVGKAFDQLKEMLSVLKPIFGGEDKQPLFTNARREALKYQLHRECFRDVNKHEQTQAWYGVLKSVFKLPTPNENVTLQGLVVKWKFEELLELNPRIVNDHKSPELYAVELGTAELQRLLNSEDSSFSFEDSQDSGDVYFGFDDEDDRSAVPPKPAVGQSKKKVTKEKPAKKSSKKAAITKVAKSTSKPDDEDVEELARSFQRACKSFSIRIEECEPDEAVIGPHVIRFYVKLGRGQRIGKLRDALEDIGREMKRSKLVVTSLHNSDRIALDIPRQQKEKVLIETVMGSIPKIESIEELPVPIGITPEGEHIVLDLAKMPHMLVAGTTGAGKTVFLYGLLASLLKTHPDGDSLRILLSSSKREDFSVFKGMQHFEGKGVVASAEKTIEFLKDTVQEKIKERSEILEENECRDIVAFNRQYENPISPFVIVIDEFADLSDQLGTSRKARTEFYTAIRQVAQAGRSRGIHLVLCTQRPSAQLLPTDIRSLMNLSVAFRMKKREDSQMIIEEPGAEQLQMHGDLLMKDDNGITRALGYFTDLKYIKAQIKK